MKELKNFMEQQAVYGTADMVNAENFPAWRQTVKTALDQLAMTGTLGNSFYAAATELSKDALALLKKAEAEDIAQAIVKGRNEGFIRSFPILGLVELSKKDPVLFKQVFDQVVLTGNDLIDFIDLTHKTRGFGRAVKSAIRRYLSEKVTPYYAMKYRKQLADAIRVSRFKGEDPVYSYILSAYPETKGYSEEKLAAAYAQYADLAKRKEFIELLEEGRKTEAAALLKDSNIDVDSLTAYYDRFDREIWQAVAKRTPVMKFLKFLAKFQREGVELAELAKEKITVSNLQRAKVFPFRLVTAELALPNVEEEAVDSVREILHGVLDDYTDNYDWSDFNRYSWVIAPDVSASMDSPIGNSSILTFSHLSAMFTAFFRRGLDRVEILPWDTAVHSFNVPKNDSVKTQMEAMLNMVGGGTYMEVAVEHMIKRRIMTDYAVFITDTMEYGHGWLTSWKKYRKLNPKAKAFLLRGDTYLTAPISEADAEKYGIIQIFGWNDSVMDYIHYWIKEKNDEHD
jgi:60 kDa SS-A/Ro ribonucleoprotein